MAIRTRYKIVGLLTVGSMINFIDRVNISVAAPSMMPALGLDKAQFGLIFSAFLAGYTLFQFPGGVMADRWNAKKMVALSCLGFSVFTALTPVAGLAFASMLVVRFLVGAFESVAFPAYASLNSLWVPRKEYSRAQTVSLSGSFLGQAIAYPLTTWLVLTFTWKVVFYFNAALGGLWLVAWVWFATNNPAEHPKVSQEELREIEENRAARSATPVSPVAVLKAPTVLLLSLSYMFLVFGVWMIIFWLPTYLVEARGFSKQAMGVVGMIPTGASFLGLVGGGILSDKLKRRGFSTRFARAQAPALCIATGIPFLVAAVLVPSGAVSVGCFAAYLMIINLATGGYWSTPLELNAKLVGAISGVMTCAGNFGGIFAPMTAGYLFNSTGRWALPFLIAAGFAAVAFAIFFFLVKPQPLELESVTPELVNPAAANLGIEQAASSTER